MNKYTYCNPLPFTDGQRHTNPDPFILRWCGKYYCYATDHNGVKVSVSQDMVLWEDNGFALSEPQYQAYWAPAVHYENGIFYLYYSNVPREEVDCHQEFLKVATATNPLGPFQWVHTFFDKFSIDAHPICWNERRYLFYSVNDWIGTDDKIVGTGILVDELVTPTQLKGDPKVVVMPTLEQEIYEKNRFGDGRDWYTIEGAATILRGDLCWLLYSGNAFVNTDYFVGSAVAFVQQNFMDMRWNKYPSPHTWHPILRKNDHVEGTGHNTVAKAPNMVDEWIIYHGRHAHETLNFEVEQREMRMDPLYFNGEQVFCLGPTATLQTAPALPHWSTLTQTIDQPIWMEGDSQGYVAEYWISTHKHHTGTSFSIYLVCKNPENFLSIKFHSGKQMIQVVELKGNIQVVLQEFPLPTAYDFGVPHCIRIEKAFHRYTIFLNESSRFSVACAMDGAFVGIAPHFTQLTVHSMALTKSVTLSGENLTQLGAFFTVTPLLLADKALDFPGGNGTLTFGPRDEIAREELTFCEGGAMTIIGLTLEDGTVKTLHPKGKTFSLAIVYNDCPWIMLDGIVLDISQKIIAISVTNAQIKDYHHTKR